MSIQIDVITYEISVDFISENEIVVSLIDGISVYQNGVRKAIGVRALNFIDGTNTTAEVDQYEGKARVKFNSTASGGGGASAWGAITGTLSDQTDLQTALDAKQDKVVVVSTNQTAANDAFYHVTASATFTDPATPVEGKGFTVFVRNGTATVGGTAYATAGTMIRRIYHSGAWANYTGVKLLSIPFLCNTAFPVDNTNYFFGGITNIISPSTTNTDQDFNIGYNCVVIGCVIQAHGNTVQGSSEDVVLSLRNNTAATTTTIGNFKTNATGTTTVSTAITGVSIPVSASDLICLQYNGAWATNPQTVRLSGYLIVEI